MFRDLEEKLMILSDVSIMERLMNDLVIRPVEFDDVQPCSVDLHLSNELRTVDNKICDLSYGDLLLEPHSFILGSTVEWVEIPTDLVGIVEGKSSLGRLGITAHVTAGYIDAGFKGNITLEIANLSDRPFRLTEDMEICQIVFEELTTPVLRPYGHSELNNHYQLSSGTVVSRRD